MITTSVLCAGLYVIITKHGRSSRYPHFQLILVLKISLFIKYVSLVQVSLFKIEQIVQGSENSSIKYFQ